MGWIYVIRTAFGVTKVGKATNVRRRLSEHRRKEGKAVLYLALPVLSMRYSERWLIRLARVFCGSPRKGREFFRQYLPFRLVFLLFVILRWITPIVILCAIFMLL